MLKLRKESKLFGIKKLIFSLIIANIVLMPTGALAITRAGLNLLTNGTLTVDGAVKFTSGAGLDKILRSDASGNATWANLNTLMTGITTDDITEGATNLYYSDTAVDARIDAQAGALGGLATLDGAGKLTSGQLPSLAINNTYVVASNIARDALVKNTGDVAIVITDDAGGSRSYIWDGASWVELLTPLDLYLTKSNNLSDLADVSTARTNLGLGSGNPGAGEILVGNGTDYSLLSLGANGEVLTLAGGTPVWQSIASSSEVDPVFSPYLASTTNWDLGYQAYLWGDHSLAGYLTSETDPNAVLKSTFTASGQLLVGTGTSTYTTVAPGATGNFLTTDGLGGVSWTSGSLALSSITPATTANTINNGDYAQRWNWNLTTTDKAGFTFGENSPSTASGSPAILKASAMGSSTAVPLFVKNLGNGDSLMVYDEESDNTPFVITETGQVGIGTHTFGATDTEKLKVEAVPGSGNVIAGYGDINAPLYLTVQNRNSGVNAVSTFAAAADDGVFPYNYLATGITSSGFADPAFPIGEPHDGFLFNVGNFTGTQGGNLIIGTLEPAMSIKFLTGGGAGIANERMRIDGSGNVGIGATSTISARLDVSPATADAIRIQPYGITSGDTGNLEFMELTSNGANYVGLRAPNNITSNTIFTLPAVDGLDGYHLRTDGAGNLAWDNNVNRWQRATTTLSPLIAGDDVTTSGDIYTSGGGAITSDGLLSGNAGLTVSGGDVSINDNSNFNTLINTGTSTGSVTIGSTNAGPSSFTSGGALTLTGGSASTWGTTAGNLTLQAVGTSTTAYIKIGAGGLGSATPDLLALDVKSTAGNPTIGTNGAMYYNASENKFKCYTNGSWGDCDTTGGTATLQSTYNSGPTIVTSSSTDIALTLTSGDFTATGAGSVNLTPTGASSFTSGGALTLTGGASSVWSTTAGALTITSAAGATWGTTAGDLTLQSAGAGTTGNIKIGAGGAGSATPDLLALDVKSTANDPLGGFNGAMYYNNSSNTFRCYENGGWKDCGSSAASATTLQQAYISGATITTASSSDFSLILASGNFTAYGAGSVNLTPTGASSFTSGGALTLTGGSASTWGTSNGNLTLQAAGAGTANVQIGTGGAGSLTPDLLALDVKSTTGDPTGVEGSMYYNTFDNKFRCYENNAWKDCDAGVVASLQTAYYNGGSITTASSTDIAYTLTSGNFTASGAGSVNLTPTGASSFTSGGALTLTAGSASTWGTTAGNLTLQAAGAGTTANVQVGVGGAGSANPDYLALDVKSTTGDPAGGAEGYMYYNTFDNKFRCYKGSAWKDCDEDTTKILSSIGTAKGDLIGFSSASTPVRIPAGALNGYILSTDLTTASGLKWIPNNVDADILNFTEFSDSMTVDAPTSISLGANNFTINADGTGDILLQDGGVNRVQVLDNGILTLTAGAASTWSTTAGALTLQGASGLILNPGTGSVQVGLNGTDGSLVLYSEQGVTDYNVTFNPNPAMTMNTTYTLPADDGTSGQALTTDGSGALSWSTGAPVDATYITQTANGTLTNEQALSALGTGLMQVTTGTGVISSVTTSAGIAGLVSDETGSGALVFGTNPTLVGVTITSDAYLNAQSDMRFADADSSNWAAIQATTTIASNYTLTLPGDDGNSNQVLTTDGNGVLFWTTPSNSLPTGTATNSTLRWNGSNWIENTSVLTSTAGDVQMRGQGDAQFYDSDSSHYVALQSPTAVTSNVTWTLPSADGTSGQMLSTDGSGVLSWTSNPASIHYVEAYDTTTQAVSVVGTFQDVMFNTNHTLDGWTHTAGTASFTAPATGVYLVSYNATIDATGGGGAGRYADLIAVFNGAEVPGSETGVELVTNSLDYRVSQSFLLNATLGQDLKIQFTGFDTRFELKPGGGYSTTKPSITLRINRIK